MAVEFDPVNKPKHYNQWPVEVIEITRHLSFNMGNAVKYSLRHMSKGTPHQDIEKAMWYLADIKGDQEVTLDGMLVRYQSAATTDPFPHRALMNLSKLLRADAMLEVPLDSLVVEALYSMADGNIDHAHSCLRHYLDNLPD